MGKDYISVQTVDAERNAKAALPVIEKSTRLKGPFYSEAFTDMLTALVWLSDKGQSEKQLRALEQKRRGARKAETEAIRQRLDDLLREREAFNRQRYGGPAWVTQSAPSLVLDHIPGPMPDSSVGEHLLFDRPTARLRPLSRATATKVRLWESLYDIALPYDVAISIRFVDTHAREVHFFDRSVVTDYGNHLTGRGNNQTLARVMALEAKAKGWNISEIDGPEEFLRERVRESIALGMHVFGHSAEAEKIIAEEWERLGGRKRERPREEKDQTAVPGQNMPEIASKPDLGRARPSRDISSKRQGAVPRPREAAKSPGAPTPETGHEVSPPASSSKQHSAPPIDLELSRTGDTKNYPKDPAHRIPPQLIDLQYPEPDDHHDGISDDVSDEELEFEDDWMPRHHREDFGPGM